MLIDFLPKKVLWLDVETTGLEKDKHGIVEFGGVIEIDRKIVREFKYNVRPFPQDEITDEALQKNGKTIDEIMKYDEPETFKDNLVKELDPYIDKFDKSDKFCPAGYNIDRYDIGFIIEFFNKVGFSYFGSYINYARKLDIYHMVGVLAALGSFRRADDIKLESIANYFEVPIKAHDALEDARATREIGYILLERLQIIKEARV